MNRTSAGTWSKSGMRKSAHRWFSTETPSQTFGYPCPQSAGRWAAIRSARLVRIWNVRLGQRLTTSHAFARHGSASAWNQSDHEQVKTSSVRLSRAAFRCQRSGKPQVAELERRTMLGSLPHRYWPVNI
jgi:hypothetical protein